MCAADGGSGNADFNFGMNILGASRRICKIIRKNVVGRER